MTLKDKFILVQKQAKKKNPCNAFGGTHLPRTFWKCSSIQRNIFKSRREFCNLLQHGCTSITLCQLQKNSGALWFHWWVTRRVKFTEAEMRVVAARLPGLVKAAWMAGVSWGQSPFGKMKVLCRWLEVMVAQRSGFAQQRWAARRAGGKTAHWMSRMRQDNLKHHSESWTIQHAT